MDFILGRTRSAGRWGVGVIGEFRTSATKLPRLGPQASISEPPRIVPPHLARFVIWAVSAMLAAFAWCEEEP
jgi:hypothetical protein